MLVFYRKKSYEIEADKLELFNDFFHNYLYPNQLKNGAELIGRWTTEDHRKIYAIWAYKSREDYERIERSVREDELHTIAQEKRKAMPPFIINAYQEYLEPTGNYHVPKHIVATSAVITNDKGEILLVKTYWRSDSWEIPGGQLEEGEAMEAGVRREVLEESGIEIALDGLTGVYKNLEKNIINLVFRGHVVGGELRTSEETKEVGFFPLTTENLEQWVTRPHWQQRIRDALTATPIAVNSYYPKR